MSLNFLKILTLSLAIQLITSTTPYATSSVASGEDVAALSSIASGTSGSGVAIHPGAVEEPPPATDPLDNHLARLVDMGRVTDGVKEQLRGILRRPGVEDPALFVTHIIRIFTPLTPGQIQDLNPQDEFLPIAELVASIPAAHRARFVNLFGTRARLFDPANPFRGNGYMVFAALRAVDLNNPATWLAASAEIRTPVAAAPAAAAAAAAGRGTPAGGRGGRGGRREAPPPAAAAAARKPEAPAAAVVLPPAVKSPASPPAAAAAGRGTPAGGRGGRREAPPPAVAALPAAIITPAVAVAAVEEKQGDGKKKKRKRRGRGGRGRGDAGH